MSILSLLIRFFVGIALVLSFQVAVAETPNKSSWTKSDVPNVMTVPWTMTQIADFLMSITNIDEPVSIGDFKFVDLLGDGNIELLVTADYSGREMFNTLLIVKRTDVIFSAQKISTLGMKSLSGVVVDLNSDGKMELLIPTPFTPYLSGSFPQAVWTAVYSSAGSIFVQDSSSFPAYYMNTVLPKLQQAQDVARVSNDPALVILSQLEYDKAVRIFNSDSEIGIETAQVLSSNTDPNFRIWAAAVLADIGSLKAMKILATLAQDPDPVVSSYAKNFQRKAALDGCKRILVDIQGTINLTSKDLIRVTIPIGAMRGAERSALKIKDITFGNVGHERSIVNCNDGSQGGIVCMFKAAKTELQPGDGVATLRAFYLDDACIIGQGAVQVINQRKNMD